MKSRIAYLQVFVAAVVFVATIPVSAAEGSKACATDLASCPINGCATQGGPDALVNKIKRTVPKSGTPIRRLTLDDFEQLQEQADTAVGQHKSLTTQQRRKLRSLSVSSGQVSEGDLVEVKGYVIAEHSLPHANTSGESVNCRLKGTQNNDFHIPIARNSEDTIFDGIVVEMIPQDRPDSWTIGKLKKIAREKRQVLVHGQLLYDNKHLVNENPAEPIGGQPARFSLWEVHPVTEFLVCKNQDQDCNPGDSQQWQRLEDYGQQ